MLIRFFELEIKGVKKFTVRKNIIVTNNYLL